MIICLTPPQVESANTVSPAMKVSIALREGSQFKWPGGGLKNIFGGRKKFDPPPRIDQKKFDPPSRIDRKKFDPPPKSTRRVYL